MTVEILCADAREGLARFPDGHFHCCVTSPPFWGLRDYGLEPTVWGPDCEHEWGEALVQYQRGQVGSESTLEGGSQRPESGDGKQSIGQGAFCRRCNAWRGTLGLEPTPELYVEHLVSVLREVRRVLRPDATCWINLGDSYNAAGRDGHGTRIGYKQGTNRASASGADGNRPTAPDLKPKDLVGIPWMVAFALRADGWWLRSDIVWAKPNPMPESVRDRPTRSHEYLFLLTKSAKYAYDQEAIREKAKDPEDDIRRIEQQHEKNKSAATAERGGLRVRKSKMPDGWATHKGDHGSIHRAGREAGEPSVIRSGRNRRSVWEIATQPYPGAHFATFPEKLVEPCILTTSEWGCCPECGAPWERVVEKGTEPHPNRWSKVPNAPGDYQMETGGYDTPHDGLGMAHTSTTTGWRPTCKHKAEPVPCRILDPFSGSGTVGLVAERLGRHSVLIDAKPEYCEMARHRTAQMGLMTEAAS